MRVATALTNSDGNDSGAGDRALLAAVASGDDHAFGELVARYERRFYSVARRMLGDDAEAEDAVQIAFLRIYTHASAYCDQWKGSTWLYRVLTNVTIDLARKRRRADDREVETVAGASEGRSADAVDLDRALAKLPSEARAILLLRYVEEMSYGEVAEVRGVSVNTVKTQLARAKKHMRRHLSEVNR